MNIVNEARNVSSTVMKPPQFHSEDFEMALTAEDIIVECFAGLCRAGKQIFIQPQPKYSTEMSLDEYKA